MKVLELKKVTKSFGGLIAVNNVSLVLNKGEILGLIGPNGAGKTTLFNLIGGNFRPDSGSIKYKDQNIIGLRSHEVTRQGLTKTFQIVKPFAGLSVIENVMIGAFLKTNQVSQAKKQARQVIEFVGLSEFADQQASTLTTAGRKRLELARALSTQAEVLLLDEVMAGLTPTESVNMVKLIHEIRERGITLLIIEHVMQAIMKLSDRIIVLHHGELIGEGKPKAIAKDEKVIKAYLGEEFKLA